MSGKAPNGIVTDQCKAMQNAIAIALSNTRHRWCLWHIMKKIPEKLKGYGEYKQIKKSMKQAVYDTLSKEEFEEKWNTFLKEYKLESNEWLKGLFDERDRWVPIFLKKEFWAGLSTTQRSESIHAFFDGYLNSKTSLQQFVKQYDNALRSKAEKEVEADFQSMNTTIPCGSNSSIEVQFQSEYTHAKFNEVQAEFRGKMNCATSLMCADKICATYIVIEDIKFFDQVREAKYEVVFNRQTHEVTCQCLLFEFRGILCRHCLSVLGIERISHVPSKYVLSRWSKKIKRRHSYIRISYDSSELTPTKERYDKLCKHFFGVAELVADDDDASKELHATLEDFAKNLSRNGGSFPAVTRTTKGQDTRTTKGQDSGKKLMEIHSPKSVPRKGRPRATRYISSCEKATKKSKIDNKGVDKVVIEESIDVTIGDHGGHNLCIDTSMEVVQYVNSNPDTNIVITCQSNMHIIY